MVREIVTLSIVPGKEAAFEAAVAKAASLFQASKGCRGMALERAVETPARYFLQIDWEAIEDHMVAFRESPAFGEWRALVGEYFASPPAMEHSTLAVRYF